MRYSAILFDLDGTLVKSEEGIYNCVSYALEKRGFPPITPAQLRSFIGPPLPVQFKAVTGCSDEEAAILTDTYRERYKPIGQYEAELYDGIIDLLTALKEAGIPTGIATSKPEVFATTVAAHFGLDRLITVLVGAGLDEQHSTKPALITTACERLGITDKSRVVMVGDRFYDIEGALAVGAIPCGVSYGYGTAEELWNAGAKWVVDSAENMKNLFL
ncbi:MAG: HAD hydrolase-like protein [Clostridia bacterium]|nr:HAD hydrolase-like protein [Clostridia bacterium]